MRLSRALSDLPELPQGDEGAAQRVLDRQQAGDGIRPMEPDPVGHERAVLYSGGHWHFRCACGFVSLGYVREEDAQLRPCEVETLLVESAVRWRRLHGAA